MSEEVTVEVADVAESAASEAAASEAAASGVLGGTASEAETSLEVVETPGAAETSRVEGAAAAGETRSEVVDTPGAVETSRVEGSAADGETSLEVIMPSVEASRVEAPESSRGEAPESSRVEAPESSRGDGETSSRVAETSESPERSRGEAGTGRAETSVEMADGSGPGSPTATRPAASRPVSTDSSIKGATGASLTSLGMKLDVTLVLNSPAEDGKGEEFPLFSLVSTNPATAPNAEVPWSMLLALSLSPDHEPPVLTVGRHKDCNVKLDDPRVSVHHFNIVARKKYAEGAVEAELGSIMYDCVLNDSSSNGTMVNGKTVGRGNSCQLHGGDEICVLPASTVGTDHTISWIFRNTTEVLATPRSAAEAPEMRLVDHVTCPVCMLVIFRCVALTPCFHNFCSSCYSDWMTRSHNCPVCRQPPNAVLKNHAMDEVIDAVLEACPDMRRTEEDMREMDRRDRLQLCSGKMIHYFDSSEDPVERQRVPQGAAEAANAGAANPNASAAGNAAASARSGDSSAAASALAVPDSVERRRSRRAIQVCVVQ